MLTVSKMIPVHTGAYGFKKQVPKAAIFKTMKIYERGSGVAIFRFY